MSSAKLHNPISPQGHASDMPEANQYARKALSRDYMEEFDDDIQDEEYDEDMDESFPAQDDNESSSCRSRSQTGKLYPNLDRLKEDMIYNQAKSKQRRKPKMNVNQQEKCPLKKAEEKIKNSKFTLVIILALILIVVLLLYLQAPKNSLSDKEVIKNFLNNALAQEYKISKKVISIAIQKALHEVEPVQPSVLLLLSSQEAMHVNRMFSKCLAKLLDTSYMQWSRNGSSASGLHENLETYFESDERNKIVLIEDLHAIPFEEARALQFFCDESNAPFKRAVFILTAVVKEIIPSDANSRTLDALASKVLNEAWKDSHEDERFALFSRITGSVAALGPDLVLPKCPS